MLTLPPLTLHRPESVADAVELLRDHPGARVLAGGTDIVPNLKYGMTETGTLVALRGLSRELRYIRRIEADSTLVQDVPDAKQVRDAVHASGELRLGALCTIDQISADRDVLSLYPALAGAASQIAGPQLRRMGTLGGNICLDTRCVYINQSHFWRQALGYCLKKDGTVCHVVKGGQRCVAAASNDTAPILMALGAAVKLVSPRGTRILPLEELYISDGIKNTQIQSDELLVEVRISLAAAELKQAYGKLRMRNAIDFPALNFGLAISAANDQVASIRLCVGALAARPAMVRHLEELRGRSIATAADVRALGEELGRRAQKQCKPLTNIGLDPEWRREIMPVLIRRGVQRALGKRSA